MDLSNLILFFVLIVVGIFSYKYFIPIFKKRYINFLDDEQFDNPQAFHELPVSMGGGLIIFFSFTSLGPRKKTHSYPFF